MKRFAWLMALVALPLAVLAQDRTVSYTYKVEGGSVSFTNKFGSVSTGNSSLRQALELKRVSFAVPSAVMTNTFAISHIRKFALPELVSTIVTTNAVTLPNGNSWVTTNSIPYPQAPVTMTNTYTIAVTTNDTGVQFYDRDDFGDGLTAESQDTLTYSFTDTNAIYLITVYDVYSRP